MLHHLKYKRIKAWSSNICQMGRFKQDVIQILIFQLKCPRLQSNFHRTTFCIARNLKGMLVSEKFTVIIEMLAKNLHLSTDSIPTVLVHWIVLDMQETNLKVLLYTFPCVRVINNSSLTKGENNKFLQALSKDHAPRNNSDQTT